MSNAACGQVAMGYLRNQAEQAMEGNTKYNKACSSKISSSVPASRFQSWWFQFREELETVSQGKAALFVVFITTTESKVGQVYTLVMIVDSINVLT